MSPQLNHTIVWCRDQAKSASFLARILGLPSPRRLLHFLIVDLANGVSMDYYQTSDPIYAQHYAFLVSDAEFDGILERLRAERQQIWADPGRGRPGETNSYFGGRGVYWEDPDGHVLEAITRPYGDNP